MNNVEINYTICQRISEIVAYNVIEDLVLNGCSIGKNTDALETLTKAIIANRSIRGIELNNNDLDDDSGEKFLSQLLSEILVPEF